MLVYMLRNTRNQKVYIGQHRGHALSTRWNKALTQASKVNGHLANAVAKYGPDAFSREVICTCSSQEEMDLLERFFIGVFQSNEKRFGYNQQAGGRLWQGAISADLRRRLSKANKRAWLRRSREEQAEAIRQWWATRSESERDEIRRKMSRARSGQKIRTTAKPWNTGLVGLNSPKKGKKYGPQKNPRKSRAPFTDEHKRRLSDALTWYWARRSGARNSCCK